MTARASSPRDARRKPATRPATGGHPLKVVEHVALLERIRAVCGSLPETREKIAWGVPTFRVRDRMFAMYHENHHGDGRVALWCHCTADARGALLASDARRFFVPPYVGHKGWVGVRVDGRPRWSLVAEVLRQAWQNVAPAKLVRSLDAD